MKIKVAQADKNILKSGWIITNPIGLDDESLDDEYLVIIVLSVEHKKKVIADDGKVIKYSIRIKLNSKR